MPELSSAKAMPRSADRFRWSIVASVVVAAAIVSVIIQFLRAWDFDEVLYSILIAPVLGIGIIIVAITFALRRRPRLGLSWFVAFVAFSSATWLQLKYSPDIHTSALWAVHAKDYKAEILAQPPDGTLKHMEWFGWGFAGSDTSVYLAYDPDNSLRHRDSATGMFGSLQCDVSDVRRLEDHWYAVTFYTNTGWDSSCDTGHSAP
jgi:hypothetical protein